MMIYRWVLHEFAGRLLGVRRPGAALLLMDVIDMKAAPGRRIPRRRPVQITPNQLEIAESVELRRSS